MRVLLLAWPSCAEVGADDHSLDGQTGDLIPLTAPTATGLSL